MDSKNNTSTPKDTSNLKKVFENDGYNKMNEAIGRMLKRLRKEHNMSVKDVKQRLHDDYGVDVAEKTLYNWENGRGMPDMSLLQPLCDNLNISLNELFSGEHIPFVGKSMLKTIRQSVLNVIR